MVLAMLPQAPQVNLTKELVFDTLLPPLIFEAAFYLRWKHLARELPVIVTLATVGVVFSGAVTAVAMHYLAHWGWTSALVFGALIAATDPVAAIATLRETKCEGRLALLIESESLFNDATAAVAFSIAILAASGQVLTAYDTIQMLLVSVSGALVCGTLVGAAALLLASRTDDHLVELTLSTVSAYGSFLLAERFHFSGVLATIVAGLMIGNFGTLGALTDRGREAVQAFWGYAAFVANSLVFLLIGMHETHRDFAAVWWPAVVAVLFVTVGRAAAVYPVSALFVRSDLKLTFAHQNALFWAGLRGALALALALSLPEKVPAREQIISVSFAVVAFSVFVQGLTVTPFLRAIGEIPPAGRKKPGPAVTQSVSR
jgi:CPA1 family monovalent cation:H+ antiporter